MQERDYQTYPAACVVHGDTTSAAAAAVSAFHLQIPVVHVEAGLRTGNTRSPYPEELNRQIISRVAAFHLAPTDRNCENLVREGVPLNRIFVCGNTAIDALDWAAALRAPYGDPLLADLEHDEATRVVVVTAHRRENWGSGLERIGTAVATLADRYPDVRFVLPVHPNPRVAEVLEARLSGRGNVSLVRPMEYTAFARLLKRAYLAITDSGGIQEEAPALGTPVLVVREETERQEGVDAGTLRLVGTDVDAIVSSATTLLDDPDAYLAMASRSNPYGDGHASERIVAAFEHVGFAAPEPSPVRQRLRPARGAAGRRLRRRPPGGAHALDARPARRTGGARRAARGSRREMTALGLGHLVEPVRRAADSSSRSASRSRLLVTVLSVRPAGRAAGGRRARRGGCWRGSRRPPTRAASRTSSGCSWCRRSTRR